MNFAQTVLFIMGLIWTIGVVSIIISMITDKEPVVFDVSKFSEKVSAEDNIVILSDDYD